MPVPEGTCAKRAAYALADSDSFPSQIFGVKDALLHDGLKQLLLVNSIERGLKGRREEKRKKPLDVVRTLEENLATLSFEVITKDERWRLKCACARICGHLSRQHFIQQNAVGPPVHRFVVGLIRHNLKRKHR